ncbi:hypothetical protein VPH35_099841 [Triticum aestivum]
MALLSRTRKFWADCDGSELAQSPLPGDLDRKIPMPRPLPCNRNRQGTPRKLSPLQKLTVPHKQLTSQAKKKARAYALLTRGVDSEAADLPGGKYPGRPRPL